jgi:hypothetical protein
MRGRDGEPLFTEGIRDNVVGGFIGVDHHDTGLRVHGVEYA